MRLIWLFFIILYGCMKGVWASDYKNDYKKTISTRVVGGENATDGEFPFVVSLQMNPVFGPSYHYCGGLILDETHVVTTAHCVDGRLMSEMEAVAGAYNLSDTTEQSRHQRRNLTSVVIHPRYDYLTQLYDMALLELDQPLNLNNFVQPVPLPVTNVELSVNCSTLGFGEGVPDQDQTLQTVNMTRVSDQTCQQIYQHIHEVDSATMVCARGMRDDSYQGSCSGDSGGPLLCIQETESGNITVVAGIFSWSMIPCGDPGYPSIYTDISVLSDFQTEATK